MADTAPFRIVFALFPGMTQLDFTGPHQFLCRIPGAKVRLASVAGGEVRSGEGLSFAGVEALADIDQCDLICVPGGMNATEVALDADFIRELRRLAAGARYVTSVCTGSLILGAAGLLKDKRATCHWGWRHLLPLFGATPEAGRVVRDGRVITGGGVTAGIDFALTVIAEVAGVEAAQAIQLGLEYDPAPPFDTGSPEKAPEALLTRYIARFKDAAQHREAEAREAASRLKASSS